MPRKVNRHSNKATPKYHNNRKKWYSYYVSFRKFIFNYRHILVAAPFFYYTFNKKLILDNDTVEYHCNYV